MLYEGTFLSPVATMLPGVLPKEAETARSLNSLVISLFQHNLACYHNNNYVIITELIVF